MSLTGVKKDEKTVPRGISVTFYKHLKTLGVYIYIFKYKKFETYADGRDPCRETRSAMFCIRMPNGGKRRVPDMNRNNVLDYTLIILSIY